jgi:hypothetical protein
MSTTSNKENQTQSLERRIAAALDSSAITAANLAVLIDETEITITSAAEAERAKALDPIASPDAAMAHGAMTEAAFMRERLRTMLPRLRERCREVAVQEYRAAWNADCDAVEVERDALAVEFREVYQPAKTKFVDLFSRMAANDREVQRIAASAPAGEPRRLANAELVARNMESFTIAKPSIVKDLRLPDFEHSERMAWPPPQALDSALFSAVPASPRYSADWALAAQEDARAARERQEREAAEREVEARTNWRGPRWWKGERA